MQEEDDERVGKEGRGRKERKVWERRGRRDKSSRREGS